MSLISKVNVPEGALGEAKVVRFEVNEHSANMSAIRDGWRACAPGTYTKLFVCGVLMMSDTPAEMRDHYEPVRRATGDVLVTGLGLGMVACAIAEKPEVRSVTVIEKSADVVALVGPHMPEKVNVVCADAFEWKAPKSAFYDVAWHDIWPDICTDNLPEIATLKRKFARKTGWQGAWVEHLLRSHRRHEQRERRAWGRW